MKLLVFQIVLLCLCFHSQLLNSMVTHKKRMIYSPSPLRRLSKDFNKVHESFLSKLAQEHTKPRSDNNEKNIQVPIAKET